MPLRERSYACHVCGWQGMLEPCPPNNDVACPNCGMTAWLLGRS